MQKFGDKTLFTIGNSLLPSIVHFGYLTIINPKIFSDEKCTNPYGGVYRDGKHRTTKAKSS